MSIHTRTLPSGARTFEVRWREAGRQRSRSFPTRAQAKAFDDQIDQVRRQGELADELRKRRVTVAHLVALWWQQSSGGLSDRTVEAYAYYFDTRILPALGSRRAAGITGAQIEAVIDDWRKRGDGDPTILKALAALQAVLSLGVRDGILTSNPVSAARKPRQQRTRVPYLVKPADVEVMRLALQRQGRERDVVLLDLLAYAGLRPEVEAVRLPWRNVRDRSLVVRGKRDRERSLPMLAPLAVSLTAWRLRCGSPAGDALVVPTAEGPWTPDDWRNWRRRVFRPVAVAAGLPADVRPRDLRGSFVSLLVHEGRSIVEVARQLGHSPEICLRDYAQVFDDFDPAARRPATEIIAEARAAAPARLGLEDKEQTA